MAAGGERLHRGPQAGLPTYEELSGVLGSEQVEDGTEGGAHGLEGREIHLQGLRAFRAWAGRCLGYEARSGEERSKPADLHATELHGSPDRTCPARNNHARPSASTCGEQTVLGAVCERAVREASLLARPQRIHERDPWRTLWQTVGIEP